MALNIEVGRRKYLNVLELPQDASNEDIKKAYKRLALQHHPDKNPDNPSATQRFQKLSQAYYQLTRKYSDKKSRSGACPECGCHYCCESDEDEDDFTDEDLDDEDEESYVSWFFRKLFVDVFGEFVSKRRFQTRKKPKSERFTPEEQEEDSFFDFIYRKYQDEDDEDIITEEDLKKFHTYDDWLKQRDPKKRPNHRTRKARKKFNSKMRTDQTKTVSKKQQLAEQHRREKEMKEISEQLKSKVNMAENKEKHQKDIKTITNEKKDNNQKHYGTSDAEILTEVEIQLKENRKNELQNSKPVTESSNNKKKRRKALKEMKKQIREEASRNLKKETEGKETFNVQMDENKKELLATLESTDINLKQMGNPAGERQTREKEVKSSILQSAFCGTAPPANIGYQDKKAELLQHHLQQYNKLMKEQPVRHTEKQMKEERIKERNTELQKQHDELMELRNYGQIKDEKTVSMIGRNTENFKVDEEFERMRREHIRKQQEMERKRNEDEIKSLRKNRMKTAQPQSALKWYDNCKQTVTPTIDVRLPAPHPTSNVWAERFRQQEAKSVPVPSSAEEEEDMLRKVLEMSQVTVKQDEERRKYRKQMASKEFIPEQLKKQMEENKMQNTSSSKPLEEPSKSNARNKWSSVVTSNLSSCEIEQEVKYTDPPDKELKVLETNYDNLKPNLKIKIPVEKSSNYDEDWENEVKDLDISPKIPNTIEKYIEWNKTAQQQILGKNDIKVPCSHKVQKTDEIYSALYYGYSENSSVPHKSSLQQVAGTKVKEMRIDPVSSTPPIVSSKSDLGYLEISMSPQNFSQEEDWELATDEKWGFNNANIRKGNISDDKTEFQTLYSQKLKGYKQRPMKSISKQDYKELSSIIDNNHNIQQVQNIQVPSDKNNQHNICSLFEAESSCEEMSIHKKAAYWNTVSAASSIQPVSGVISSETLHKNISLQKIENLSQNKQMQAESWDDELLDVPQQFSSFSKVNLPVQSVVNKETENLNRQTSLRKTNFPAMTLPKYETEYSDRQSSLQSVQTNRLLSKEDYSKAPCKNSNSEYSTLKNATKSDVEGKCIVIEGVNVRKEPVTDIYSENWEDDLIPVVMPDSYPITIDQGKKIQSTASKPLKMDNQLNNSDVLHTCSSVKSDFQSGNTSHRLPVLKNLSTSSIDMDLPSVRLPRLPHVSGKIGQKMSSLPLNKQENENSSRIRSDTPNKSLAGQTVSSTLPQDLSANMAGLNMPIPSMNMPVGLPPHLMQAYVQFLQSSGNNSNAIGMLPALANMPLLPGLLPILQNPLMSASPVLAYSLQQQQLAAMNMTMATSGMPGSNMLGLNMGSTDVGRLVGQSMMQNTPVSMGQTSSANVSTEQLQQQIRTNKTQEKTSDCSTMNNLELNNVKKQVDKNINLSNNENKMPSKALGSRFIGGEILQDKQSQKLMNFQNPSDKDISKKNMVDTTNKSDLPSFSKAPYDLQKKREQLEAVQALISGLKKEPGSLLENSDMDPRHF